MGRNIYVLKVYHTYMMKKKITGIIFILILLTGAIILINYGKPLQMNDTAESAIDVSLEGRNISNNVSQIEIDAMNMAIQDEYKAEQTYEEVMKKFGDVRPFSNIINAEIRHSTAIAQLFMKYGMDVPDPQTFVIEIPDTLQAACSEGVAAEKANIALYEELLPQLSQPDVLQVFQNNMAASQDKHLPAFSRCAQ